MTSIFFVAGLPRSGATLLLNILAQRPDCHVASPSGLYGVYDSVKAAFAVGPFFKAMDKDEMELRQKNTLLSILRGYYAHTNASFCFDKHRAWPSILESLAWVLGRDKIKVVACVRDLREVAASFEVLHRKTEAVNRTTQSLADPVSSSLAAGRMERLLQQGEVIGSAYNAMTDAATRGWNDCIYYLDYAHLCKMPSVVMADLYSFLSMPVFDGHDFDNVEQVTWEDDRVHGWEDLHTIRNKVEVQDPKWPKVFDDSVFRTPIWQRVTQLAEFWR